MQKMWTRQDRKRPRLRWSLQATNSLRIPHCFARAPRSDSAWSDDRPPGSGSCTLSICSTRVPRGRHCCCCCRRLPTWAQVCCTPSKSQKNLSNRIPSIRARSNASWIRAWNCGRHYLLFASVCSESTRQCTATAQTRLSNINNSFI